MKDEKVKHAARQLDNGYWASKIGSMEDIIHEKPVWQIRRRGLFHGKAKNIAVINPGTTLCHSIGLTFPPPEERGFLGGIM
jgi:hypothetical protein